jgi:Fe-S cluster assembly ATPase SufC
MDEIIKWVTSRFQLIALIISIISGAGGVVYAANEYVEQFALDEDVAKVQKQFSAMHYQSQVDLYQEKAFEIEDKIIDETVTNVELKKLKRIQTKINNLKSKIEGLERP